MKNTKHRIARAFLLPCTLITVTILIQTLFSIITVLAVKTTPDSPMATVYYFVDESLSLFLPLSVSILLFTCFRNRLVWPSVTIVLLYLVVSLLAHIITTAFYCQLVFDSLWGWTEQEFVFFFSLTKETLLTMLYILLPACVTFAILPAQATVPTGYSLRHPVVRSIFLITAAFLIGAFVQEMVSYTIPALSEIAEGYSTLQVIDAIYIVFKYVFYLALSVIAFVFGVRHYKRLTTVVL